MKKILLVLPFITALQGATVLPDTNRYVWNFNLASTISSSSQMDTLSILFHDNDKLTGSDLLKIRLYDGESSLPVYSFDWGGSIHGIGNVHFINENWDELLASRWGRLELEMETGMVELKSLILVLQTGTNRHFTSISPNVRLVPEAGILSLLPLAGVLAFKRKRQNPHPSRSGFSQ